MTHTLLKRMALAAGLGAATLGLSACDPTATGSVSTGVYYDSVLWNDYYYGHPRPPVTKPPRPKPPVAKPPRPKPPIHRPPVARPLPGRPR